MFMCIVTVFFIFFIYIKRYDRQAVGPPDGKPSPSPRYYQKPFTNKLGNAVEEMYSIAFC